MDSIRTGRYLAAMIQKSAAQNSSDRRESSRLALIHNAQRLFATDTIDGVSLREIATAAGHGNLNAVQYHFGDKRGLVRGIYEANFPALEKARSACLAKCAQDNALGDLQALMGAQYRPLLDIVDADGRHSYASFNLQVQTSTKWREVWWELITQLPVTLVISKLLSNLMGDVAKSVRDARFRYASILILQMISDVDNAGETDEATRIALIDDAFACASRVLVP